MRDKIWGVLLFILTVLTMVGYFCLLFLSPVLAPDLTFLGRPLTDWAVIIPVMILVYMFLFVVAWVGWALATTPPPLLLTEENEEEKGESGEEG